MGYWQRKYHLKYSLPDGNVWTGFINVEADNESELPEAVKGIFWAEKKSDGWYGRFCLDNYEPYDRRRETSEILLPWVITIGIHRPSLEMTTRPTSIQEADRIMEYLKPVEYETVARFDGRLEDCYVDSETHYWCQENIK